MGRVIIGMDPHKRSATEIINDREKILAQGRFGTDRPVDGVSVALRDRSVLLPAGTGRRA
ncbi:hypothetical protein ACPPVO_54585 [Dactylosporangium sp. McL0621]|uniref:hypothetical protein n=1 Tax=Dactylosporangium sp. McL0621 TaxID=3415678 RepID=UPI003CE7F919